MFYNCCNNLCKDLNVLSPGLLSSHINEQLTSVRNKTHPSILISVQVKLGLPWHIIIEMGAVGSCEVEGLSVAVIKGGKKDWSLLCMLMCVCVCALAKLQDTLSSSYRCGWDRGIDQTHFFSHLGSIKWSGAGAIISVAATPWETNKQLLWKLINSYNSMPSISQTELVWCPLMGFNKSFQYRDRRLSVNMYHKCWQARTQRQSTHDNKIHLNNTKYT